MDSKIIIRRSQNQDMNALDRLYPAAFPDEDLLPLLHHLLRDRETILSLVVIRESTVIAHILFTHCHIIEQNTRVALLGPLAVHPDHQCRGIGSSLIHAGFQRLHAQHIEQIFVLGDPAYYSRFGFTMNTHTQPPYALPKEWKPAWQSICLGTHPANDLNRNGILSVPEPWHQQALWTP